MGEVRPKSKRRACDICCHGATTFCVGECNHPICFVCATRIRVVCETKDCPICRRALEKVFFVDNADRQDGHFVDKDFIAEPFYAKYGFHFENEDQIRSVEELLSNVCEYCRDRKEFKNFKDLERHFHRVHQLTFCDICVENLKLFPRERKCYTYRDLARHRRAGDPDDSSHKGHPRCNFCDERFMDDDQLFRHLRINHFMCHLCDADGCNRFFPDNTALRGHFKANHFLCEEGECKSEPIGVAFGTEIDFKAHRASVHSREFSKSQLKMERTVRLDFGEPSERRKNFDHRRKVPYDAPPPVADAAVPKAREFTLATEDFPTLGSDEAEMAKSTSSKQESAKQPDSFGRSTKFTNEENAVFVIGSQEPTAALKANSNTSSATISQPPGGSVAKPKANLLAPFGTRWATNRFDSSSFEEQFPALQISEKMAASQFATNWMKPVPQNSKPAAIPKTTDYRVAVPASKQVVAVSSVRRPQKPSTIADSLSDFPPLPAVDTVVKRTFPNGTSAASGLPPPPGFSAVAGTALSKHNQPTAAVDSFVAPFDFEERNRWLAERIQRELNEDDLLRFKVCNGRFRSGEMSPRDYCSTILELMGQKLFVSLFPELLCLLPDVERQNQLFNAYNAVARDHGGDCAPRLEPLSDIVPCRLCSQLLMLTDLPDHKIHHQQPW